jgi:hypothetical protein
MPRAARTLIIVVVLGLVGLLALTWLARRYANLTPQASVRDVVPAPAPAPAGEVPAPPAPSPAPAAPEPTGPGEAQLRELDRFIAVRSALQKVAKEHPHAAKQIAEQLGQGDASEIKPLQFNLIFLMKYRLARETAIQQEAWTFEGYRDARAVVEGWRAGKPPADPAFASALEARRAALEGADLGGLEKLDRVADSGTTN